MLRPLDGWSGSWTGDSSTATGEEDKAPIVLCCLLCRSEVDSTTASALAVFEMTVVVMDTKGTSGEKRLVEEKCRKAPR